MIKRYSIISLLFLAYAIVFAHNIIPHHHHDEEQVASQLMDHEEGDHHHHDNDEDDDGSLAHEFESYLHISGSDHLYQKSDLKIDCNTIAAAYTLAIFDHFIDEVKDPPAVASFSEDYIPITQHYFCSKGLRAPPLA